MAFLTAVLFSLIFSIAYSDILSIDKPINGTIGPLNLQTVATLNIDYNANISICIVSDEFGLPAYNLYGEDVCIWFAQWGVNSTHPKVDRTETIALRNMKYQIGIYFTDPAQVAKNFNATITWSATGEVCPVDEIYDTPMKKCLAVTQLHNWNETFPLDLHAGETTVYTWNNPNDVGHFEFASQLRAGLTAESIIILARYNGAPSQDVNDGADVGGVLTVETPKPGPWVISVRALEDGKATILFTGEVCPKFQAGKDCKISVSAASNILNLTVTSNPVYYRLLVNKTTNTTQVASMLVSVTTDNVTRIPTIYATRGQIPNKDNADILNCNRGYCNIVRSIGYNATEDEEWYISVQSGTGNVTSAVWFYTHCIPNCEDDSHGLCTDAGTCDCEIDYEGINCGISKGLGPQYIVLIIIASLVVASAVIGFVAWAYMRQKRGAYEPLT